MKRVGAKPKSIPEKGQSHESTPEGGVFEITQVGAEESIRHSTLSHLFSLILFCPLPRGRIDLCDAWTGHRSADAERSTMLPVEHTLYAHLCFLKVAARRSQLRVRPYTWKCVVT